MYNIARTFRRRASFGSSRSETEVFEGRILTPGTAKMVTTSAQLLYYGVHDEKCNDRTYCYDMILCKYIRGRRRTNTTAYTEKGKGVRRKSTILTDSV